MTTQDPVEWEIEKVSAAVQVHATNEDIYPADQELLPVEVHRVDDGWVITQEERTGVEVLSGERIDEQLFALRLNDAQSNIEDGAYDRVAARVDLFLGDGSTAVGTSTFDMSSGPGGIWRGPAS